MIGPRTLAALALAGMLAVTHGWAYRQGVAAEAARSQVAREALQRDLFEAAESASRAAAALADLRAAQDTRLMEFEDEARADPAAADRRPGPDSLRRLEDLWRGARPAP